jgi:methylated-DNA-[protein]-cysteine S-methyltransferase
MVFSYYTGKMRRGWISVLATTNGVRGVCLPQRTKGDALKILFAASRAIECLRLEPDTGFCLSVFERLAAYFDGELKSFDFTLDTSVHSAFDQSVWNQVKTIPYGEMRSYSWVAQELGKLGSARAVGGALGRNPLPILIPCHRVISVGGGLCGFSGGLEWKERLLRLENAWRT